MRPILLPTFFALPGLAVAIPLAQFSPTDIITTLTSLTTQSQALMGPADQLSIINAPLLIIGQGPWATLLTGFTDIITTVTAGTAALPPPGTQFTSTDEQAITDAFQAFGTAQMGLLAPIAQAGTAVEMVPAIGPMVSGAIVQASTAVEGFAARVQNLLGEDGAEEVNAVVGDLKKQFEAALKAFD